MYIIGDVCCAGDKTQNIKVKEAKVFTWGYVIAHVFYRRATAFLIQRC